MFDDNSGVSLTRRRLLGGLTTIGVAGAASGAGTWAYFSDTEESTGNIIEAGSVELSASNFDGEDVSRSWTIDDAKPGSKSEKTSITLRNDSSVSVDHVEIGFSVTETEDGTVKSDTKPSSADGMAEQFVVTDFEYHTDVSLDDLSDANGNGIVDLGDLVNGNDSVLDDLPAPGSGGSAQMEMAFRWADDSEFDNSVSGTNNDYQGDELDLTVTFTLHQDSSQDS